VLAACCAGALLGAPACTVRKRVLSTSHAGSAGASPDELMATTAEPVLLGTPPDSSGSPLPVGPNPFFAPWGPSPCAVAPTAIVGGLDAPHALATTPNHVYVSAADGIWRSDHDGAEVRRVVDRDATSIAAYDTRLVWSADGQGMAITGQRGAASVLLAATAAIAGIAQDDAALYAVADGNLVSVLKTTREVRVLVDGRAGNALQTSEAAVDGSFVYFASHGADDSVAIERVSKAGGDRALLGSIAIPVAGPLRLMVDSAYIYVVSDDRVSRLSVNGGDEAETLIFGSTAAMVATADDFNLYYAAGSTLFCVGKADGVFRPLLTLDAGVFTGVAVDGSELYFGVAIADGPPGAGWVGRLECDLP
jgi:hypothetical protein